MDYREIFHSWYDKCKKSHPWIVALSTDLITALAFGVALGLGILGFVSLLVYFPAKILFASNIAGNIAMVIWGICNFGFSFFASVFFYDHIGSPTILSVFNKIQTASFGLCFVFSVSILAKIFFDPYLIFWAAVLGYSAGYIYAVESHQLELTGN